MTAKVSVAGAASTATLKRLLVTVTTIAVVSDTMLMPFYPQFFADTFGVTDPRHVGLYIAAFCGTVMTAFPFWARLSARIPTLQLLIWTQIAAGLFSLLSYRATSLVEFWLVSLSMFVFKASYLLIYPYVMSLERKESHAGTIGLLSVIVHFGSILGALLSGFVIQIFEPIHVFAVMAAGDFIQALLCFLVVRRGAIESSVYQRRGVPEAGESSETSNLGLVCKLGSVMLVLYFSEFLLRPFFSRYWESISIAHSRVLTGLVFAVPALVALVALWFNHRASWSSPIRLSRALGLAAVGTLLQSIPQPWLVVAGRCLFGWAMFQATVRLDLILFERSSPESYASDFSKVHIFQQLGPLLASFAAGSLVATRDLHAPFVASTLGLLLTIGLYRMLFSGTAPAATNQAMVTS